MKTFRLIRIKIFYWRVMKKMKKLIFYLKKINRRNLDGSRSTQSARWRNMDLTGRQLHQPGYINLRKES